ncbi:MAG: box helicase [Lachnospiraceae bacterium]|jgi:SNF2 family DNA or RNA helicase|nr:box helicase [Lachnospiraceae bacterium]
MKFVPHDYQRYCINRLIAENMLGLFLDMGLGKTAITLTAVNDLRYNRFQVRKVLVIAPKKVAEDTWTREVDKWDHLKLLRVIPVLGTEKKRIKALNSPGDVYVLSRDNVQWLVEYYRNSWPFDMVVVDELSSFKNPSAKRFKKLCLVRPHIKRMVGLTGTPAPNGLMDLWAQVFLLDSGQRLESTVSAYREQYFQPDQRNRERVFTYMPKIGAEDLINQKIKDICISLSAKDYLTLPDRIDNVRYIKLDAKAQARYDELQREMLLEIDETTIDAGSAAVLSNKLLQLCNGAIYDEGRNVIEIHDNKLEAFMEIVEAAQGKPLLVFYNFQHDLARLQKILSKTGLRISELRNPQSIDAWNNKQIDVLLAHPASAAYGLNLQAGGNIIVWYGLTWSLELYQQANARLYRQGQTEAVIIHHLVVAGSMDEEVMGALENKRVTQDDLLNALKAQIRKVREG